MLKSKSKRGYSALPPISSFCLLQIIGLSHLVMCGAYTATIPPDSWLSMYRLLAGVYYSEGRCQGEEEVVVEVAGRLWRLWRQVKDYREGWTASVSSLLLNGHKDIDIFFYFTNKHDYYKSYTH